MRGHRYRRRETRNFMNGLFGRITVIWVLALASLWIAHDILRGALLTMEEPYAVTARGDLAEFEALTNQIFEAAAPSVAYIFTEESAAAGSFGRRQPRGAGSGFVWDAAGHIVTNFHVVSNAQSVRVRLDKGEPVPAVVVGSAPEYDLAVLRLSHTRAMLRPLPIGSSDDLRIGQAVFAIGNPFGLSRSLSTGVISAIDRHLPIAAGREIRGVIQTDAAINPGNSGGPLLDSAGRLIGVNTAILSQTGSWAGVGFAVPVGTVNRIVPQLVRDGRVPRPGIGVAFFSEEMAARLGYEGLVVAEVLPDSAAERAGIRGVDRRAGRLGDIITEANGRPVYSISDLAEVLEEIGIGKSVELTIVRDGREHTVSVQIMDIA
jgi:2-alkenal reductase